MSSGVAWAPSHWRRMESLRWPKVARNWSWVMGWPSRAMVSRQACQWESAESTRVPSMSQSTARVGVIGDLMLEHFEGFSLAGDGASSQRIVGRGGAMFYSTGEISPSHSSYEKGCQVKKASPRPSERCGRGDLHPAPPHSSPYS